MTKKTRVAVVGIGQELCGDDGAGVAVVKALKATEVGREDLLLIDAGAAPENQIGPLRRFTPGVILFVDTVEMGEVPGTIRWVSLSEADGLGASTHTLSPQVLATLLTCELGCEVHLLGIQPLRCEVGKGLAPAVAQAVGRVARALLGVLARDDHCALPDSPAG